MMGSKHENPGVSYINRTISVDCKIQITTSDRESHLLVRVNT